MRRELFSIAIITTLALAASGCAASDSKRDSARTTSTPAAQSRAEQPDTSASAKTEQASTDTSAHDGHGAKPTDASHVPAFEVSEAALKSLPPTLAPELFTGKTRAAYQAVKEIPKTIAQLPCYCHCDENFGHKSLHSCFSGEDRHASQCAVCVEEALTAYRLQKEEHLKPAQIRERIVAEYQAQGF